MFTRSGKRRVVRSRSGRGQARERGCRDPYRRERAAHRVAPDRSRQRGVDHAVLRVARRRVGRERDIRVGCGDHEVDLRERGGHRGVRLQAELLGDRGRAQVVERLRQVQAERDFVGEVGRAPRPLVAELGEQRREVAHHPLRGEVREVELEIDLDQTGRVDEHLGGFAHACLDRRRDIDDAAERREHRDAPAREVVRAEPGFPAAERGQAGRVARRRSPRTRRRSAPRRAPSGRGSRARRCSGRENACGDRGIRPNVPFMPSRPV